MKKEVKVIVSLTTHSIRLNTVAKTAIFSIIQNTFKDLKIVLTLYKDDVKNIPSDLQLMIDNRIVELIVADKDLGPHLKYFYAMQKYKDLPVITIDDDILYPETMIERLYENHIKYPDCVIARRCFDIEVKNGKLTSYNTWLKRLTTVSEPSYRVFATGIGGILYPPNCLKLSENNINEILEVKYDDDFYLKALESRNDIKILPIHFNWKTLYLKNLDDKETQSISLWNNKNKKDSNSNMLKFEKEFLYYGK